MKFCSVSTLVLGASWVLSCALVGCGDRRVEFDAGLASSNSATNSAVGLNEAVALLDEPLDRVVVLQGDRQGALRRTALPVGQNPILMQSDVSGDRILVLSRGVQPRLRPFDELPSLTILGAKGKPGVISVFELSDQYSRITLDPDERWAVLSGADSGDSVVSNPNQLVLIDLEDEDAAPINKTIRSFGAAPERFFFTEALDLPGGERRFLVVETNQDIHLIDLADLDTPEITIKLPVPAGAAVGRPEQVVAHPGVEDVDDDALLAIRLRDDSNLMLINFVEDEAESAGRPFKPTLNLVDVAGVASSIEFVQTDSGVRLAALIPNRREAVLVDPDTTRIETVSLPSRFDKLRRVEAEDSNSDAGDMALLWGENTSQVAFWSLGRTAERAFRSIDVLDLDASVSAVLDVPGRRLSHRKLVQSNDSRFFVLDLEARQSFPMFGGNDLEQVALKVSSDGVRAWAYEQGSTGLAQIDLETLQPTSLRLERPIGNVFDIKVNATETRVLIVLHPGGALGATVMDSRSPDTANTRFVPGLLLGGLL